MLFDPSENNNNESKNGENPVSENDDLVDSSFAVSFRSNDPVNTVEGKLKENKDNLDDGFKDEFDDFEFDSSISAFKPLNNADTPKEEKAETSFAPFKMAEGAEVKKPEAKPEAVKSEEPAKMPEPSAPINEAKPASPAPSFPKDNGTFEVDNKAEAVPDAAAPVFDDNDKDLMDFGGLNAEDPSKDKLFNSGNDLDFATSESNKPKSPFAQKPQTQAPQAKPAPSKAEDKGIETFGKVNSGMDAFKKPSEPQIPESKPQEKVKPQAPYRPQPSASQKPAAPVNKEAPIEKKPEAAPVAPAVVAAAETKPEAKAPVKPEVKASAPANMKPETAAKPAPQSNAGRVLNATPATHRPGAGGESRPAASPRPAPAKRPTNPAFENAAARQERNAEAAKKAQLDHEQQKKITPVTPAVNRKRRKSDKPVREPGKGGVITLAVIIVLFIGILWVLDNTEKLAGLFNGKKNVETVPTRIEQTEESETTAAPSETTAAPETSETETTTTAATTEATTETSETTTEATTEATTTEATTTTTTTAEATTTTTTAEATTTTTTASSSTGGVKVTNFKTKLNHFSTTAGGFKFDITLTNKSDKDASLTLSLKEVDITIRSDAEITDVTCDQFTFTSSGNNKYVGVPNDIMIPAGESVTYTVYVSTSSSVSHYGYDYCYFEWK